MLKLLKMTSRGTRVHLVHPDSTQQSTGHIKTLCGNFTARGVTWEFDGEWNFTHREATYVHGPKGERLPFCKLCSKMFFRDDKTTIYNVKRV